MEETKSKEFTNETIGIICSQLMKITIEYEKLKVENKELKKQLTLSAVVTSVLCVHNDGFSSITEGKKYILVEEGNILYKITDDDGYLLYYDKNHFEKI
jgi:hypothetical protein